MGSCGNIRVHRHLESKNYSTDDGDAPLGRAKVDEQSLTGFYSFERLCNFILAKPSKTLNFFAACCNHIYASSVTSSVSAASSTSAIGAALSLFLFSIRVQGALLFTFSQPSSSALSLTLFLPTLTRSARSS